MSHHPSVDQPAVHAYSNQAKLTAICLDDEEERRSCWCDCVVSDEQPSASLLQRAEYLGIPVLSVNWAVQCLVNRKKVNFGEDERYRYDHKDT